MQYPGPRLDAAHARVSATAPMTKKKVFVAADEWAALGIDVNLLPSATTHVPTASDETRSRRSSATSSTASTGWDAPRSDASREAARFEALKVSAYADSAPNADAHRVDVPKKEAVPRQQPIREPEASGFVPNPALGRNAASSAQRINQLVSKGSSPPPRPVSPAAARPSAPLRASAPGFQPAPPVGGLRSVDRVNMLAAGMNPAKVAPPGRGSSEPFDYEEYARTAPRRQGTVDVNPQLEAAARYTKTPGAERPPFTRAPPRPDPAARDYARTASVLSAPRGVDAHALSDGWDSGDDGLGPVVHHTRHDPLLDPISEDSEPSQSAPIPPVQAAPLPPVEPASIPPVQAAPPAPVKAAPLTPTELRCVTCPFCRSQFGIPAQP